MPEFNSFVVNSIKRITLDSVVLTFKIKPELKQFYRFSAGQYVTLELQIDGVSVRRSYSICSEPDVESLEVGIKKVQNGIFSTYVNEKLKICDSIKVGKPEGRFIWEPNEKDKIMAIAAGSGITPIMSIIKSVIKHSEKSSLTLIYCNKSPDKTMFYNGFCCLVRPGKPQSPELESRSDSRLILSYDVPNEMKEFPPGLVQKIQYSNQCAYR